MERERRVSGDSRASTPPKEAWPHEAGGSSISPAQLPADDDADVAGFQPLPEVSHPAPPCLTRAR